MVWLFFRRISTVVYTMGNKSFCYWVFFQKIWINIRISRSWLIFLMYFLVQWKGFTWHVCSLRAFRCTASLGIISLLKLFFEDLYNILASFDSMNLWITHLWSLAVCSHLNGGTGLSIPLFMLCIIQVCLFYSSYNILLVTSISNFSLHLNCMFLCSWFL